MNEIELDKLLCKYADTKNIKYLERMKKLIDKIISDDLINNIVIVKK